MNALNTNSRPIRTSNEGFSVSRGAICDHCGLRSLCNPVSPPPVCASFSPLFVFRSPLIGFEGSFNTFRIGANTYRRFENKCGTIATLYDKRRNAPLGWAKIKGVALGPMQDVLNVFAHQNHLAIGRGIKKNDAPAWLGGVLRKNYKTMFKVADHSKQPFSVVFLERLDDENVRRGFTPPQAPSQEVPVC